MRARKQRFRVNQSHPIHVLRETKEVGHCWAFFLWLENNHRRFSRLFHYTTAEDDDLAPIENTSLFIPWIQDPLKERNPDLFERVSFLEKIYEQNNVPIVNPVRNLSNAIKSRALPVIKEAGIRTARCRKINRDTRFNTIADAIGVPFIVRNDQGHGGSMHLVHNPDELHTINWKELPQPLALEFIDTRCRDGLYRKYRYLLTGDKGITRHLVISRFWNVHAEARLKGREYINEEMNYINSANPFQETLNRARKTLELDYVAFDYSIDGEGELVVWEPNPHPCLWNPENIQPYYKYQRLHVDRVFRQIMLFYLNMASLLEKTEQVPEQIL